MLLAMITQPLIWVLVFGGIALAGLVMVACFALWLWRKATALFREAGVLMDRAGELLGLLDQIDLPSEALPARGGRRPGEEGPDSGAGESHRSGSRAT